MVLCVAMYVHVYVYVYVQVETSIDTCCGTVGVEIEAEEIVRLASKMQLEAKLGPSPGTFTVKVRGGVERDGGER